MENDDYSYLVEEIMIDGFEIFQQNNSSFTKKFKLSPHAPIYIPLNDTKRFTKVSDLDLSTVKPSRGGVIISTMFQGSRWFGFGQDWKTGEITDFGGGIYYGKDTVTGKVIGRRDHGSGRGRRSHIDRNAIDGCLREFKEESLSVFPEISYSMIENSTVLHSKKMMIIIISLDVCPYKISESFHSRVSKMSHHEIKSIFWIPESEVKQKLSHNVYTKTSPFKFYSKVCTLLKEGTYV